jgi:hypothetical protein
VPQVGTVLKRKVCPHKENQPTTCWVGSRVVGLVFLLGRLACLSLTTRMQAWAGLRGGFESLSESAARQRSWQRRL